jgi:hypothetical protein
LSWIQELMLELALAVVYVVDEALELVGEL